MSQVMQQHIDLEESNNAMNEIFPQDLYLQNGSSVLNEVNQEFNIEIEGLLDKFAGNKPS